MYIHFFHLYPSYFPSFKLYQHLFSIFQLKVTFGSPGDRTRTSCATHSDAIHHTIWPYFESALRAICMCIKSFSFKLEN